MTAYPGAPRVAVPLQQATSRCRFLIFASLGAAVFLPGTSFGQAPASEDRSAAIILREGPIEWSPRRFDFHDEGGRRSPVGAAILGAYVPLAGYAYAGSWKRGIAPQALWLSFAAGMAYASDCDSDGGCSSTQETVGAVAWMAGVASVFWGGVGAYRTARAHNRAVEERPQIEARSGGDGSVSVGLRVPFR
jgi:hypothetical protein